MSATGQRPVMTGETSSPGASTVRSTTTKSTVAPRRPHRRERARRPPLALARLDAGRRARPRPVGVVALPARPVHALVRVGAEVVALRLDQVRGQALGAVAVVERQR